MMKRMVPALLLSTALSAPALAAEMGPYIGLDLGQSSTDTYNLSTKTATAWSILAGYQFHRNVAAEIQYNDFGSPTIMGGSSFKINGYSAAVLGILPFTDQWAGLLKLGYASMKLGSPLDSTHSDFTWGIAGQYSVDRNWGVRLNYDQYKVEAAGTKATTSAITLSGLYRF